MTALHVAVAATAETSALYVVLAATTTAIAIAEAAVLHAAAMAEAAATTRPHDAEALGRRKGVGAAECEEAEAAVVQEGRAGVREGWAGFQEVF